MSKGFAEQAPPAPFLFETASPPDQRIERISGRVKFPIDPNFIPVYPFVQRRFEAQLAGA